MLAFLVVAMPHAVKLESRPLMNSRALVMVSSEV